MMSKTRISPASADTQPHLDGSVNRRVKATHEVKVFS
jgi:hypothetical protein